MFTFLPTFAKASAGNALPIPHYAGPHEYGNASVKMIVKMWLYALALRFKLRRLYALGFTLERLRLKP